MDTMVEVHKMRTRVQELGDGLALHIPKTLATEMHIRPDSLIEMLFVDGKIIMFPITEAELTLEQLLAGVAEENLHGEVDTGSPVGKEVW
ncbi:MAG: AbrB/MazE/SpoVT family DNA-binding domain-containing protein [Anaerolineae bacterium]